jgi:hypothetical protein
MVFRPVSLLLAVLIGAAAVAGGCLPRAHWRPPVELTARLADSVLPPAGTLRIERRVANRGVRTLALASGTTEVPFSLTDSAGRPACPYTGAYTLGLVLQELPPGTAAERPVAFPLRGLERCGPGRYVVHTWVVVHPDAQGTGEPGVIRVRAGELWIREP